MYTCAIMLEKLMVWWENGVQKHIRYEITVDLGAEHMLYLQEELLWIYGRVQDEIAVFNGLSRGVFMYYCTQKGMFWWEIWFVQNYNRCGVTDIIGTEHTLYLQDKLL